MAQMAWLDFVIIGIISLSAVISLIRGFVREAFSLAVWFLAFWVSWSFFRDLAVQLEPWIDTPSVRLGVAFTILMVVTLVIGGLVNYLIIQLVERTGLSGSDRLIGMIFGIARGVLLVSALVLLAGLTPFPGDPWWQNSHLVPYFEELAVWLMELLPEDIAQRFQYAASVGPATLGRIV
jgi:membrane protein required for colicin V production